MTTIISPSGQKNNEFAQWDITKKYRVGDLVIYSGKIYEVNDFIPANTPFATGTTGATWSLNVDSPTNGVTSNGTSSTQVNVGNVTTVIGGTTVQTVDANGMVITGNANVSGNITANGSISGNTVIANTSNTTTLNVTGNANLGAVGNLKISGGSNGQVLKTDGNGNLAWTTSVLIAQGLIVNTSDTTANLQILFTNGSGGFVDTQTTQLSYQPSTNKLTVSNIAANGNVSAGGLAVNGTSTLGPVGNVSITGGTTGQVLTTDGSGVLTWSTISTSGASNGTSGTQVNASNVTTVIGGTTIQTIDANGVTITGNANVSGNVNASYFIGNGSQLTDIAGSNIVGNVTSAITANFANFAGNVTVNAQPNITSVGTLTSLTTSGDIAVGGNLTVNGTTTTVNSVTLDVTDKNITIAKDATTPAAADGAGLTVSGAGATMTYTSGNDSWNFNKPIIGNISNAGYSTLAATANSVDGANVSGNVTSAITANFANYAGNVTVAAQPNITSVGTLTALAVSGTTNLGAVGNVTIIGGTTGQTLTTDGAGVLSWASPSNTKYTREFHVDPVIGNDTTGDGSYNKPYATIMKAHSVITSGQAVYLHLGTYAENVTWTKTNTDIIGMSQGGAVNCTGTWTVGTTSPASVRITDMAFNGTFEQNGTGRIFFRRCQVNGAFSKTSGEYLQAIDTDFGTSISITSAGTVVIKGAQTNGLTVNHASAIVNISNLISGAVFTNTLGTLLVNDSIIYSATTTTPAISSAAGTVTYLYNTSTATTAGTTARIALAGFWTTGSSRYDVANSTLTGTNLGTVSYFDAVNTQGLANVGSLQVRGTSTLGPVGNVSITGGTTGQVLTTDGSGVLTWATAAAGGASIPDGTTNLAQPYWLNGAWVVGPSTPVGTFFTATDDAQAATLFPQVGVTLNAAAEGQKYYDTTTNQLKLWDGSAWSTVANYTSTSGLYAKNFVTEAKAQTTTTVIDFAQSVQQFTVSAARTFTTSNVPATGTVASVSLILVVSSSATITWPTGTKWPSGTLPTLANGTHIVSLMTYDGGTTYLGAALTAYA